MHIGPSGVPRVYNGTPWQCYIHWKFKYKVSRHAQTATRQICQLCSSITGNQLSSRCEHKKSALFVSAHLCVLIQWQLPFLSHFLLLHLRKTFSNPLFILFSTVPHTQLSTHPHQPRTHKMRQMLCFLSPTFKQVGAV